jgi:hypothetical protein
MKSTSVKIVVLCLTVLLANCGKKEHQHEGHNHGEAIQEESGNNVLDREVMKVHDEAMAKMDEIYKLKQQLKKKFDESASTEQKAEIEKTIAKLDSADASMMNWMHQYKPFPDSVFGEEKAREYLESEIEKIKKVRQDMLDAIEQAKQK